jgi:hypothetical protein
MQIVVFAEVRPLSVRERQRNGKGFTEGFAAVPISQMDLDCWVSNGTTLKERPQVSREFVPQDVDRVRKLFHCLMQA